MMATDLRFPLPNVVVNYPKRAKSRKEENLVFHSSGKSRGRGGGACTRYAPAINCMKIKSLFETCKESF